MQPCSRSSACRRPRGGVGSLALCATYAVPETLDSYSNGGALGGNRTPCLAVRSPQGAVQDGPDGARRCLRVFRAEPWEAEIRVWLRGATQASLRHSRRAAPIE